MKVFISWSGDRSRQLAQSLSDFLPQVIQQVQPFMSASSIAAGESWGLRLAAELENTDFGILCLTSDNLKSAWISFEAGALSKKLGASSVCPCLHDLRASDLSFPLAQFQAKTTNRNGLFDIVKAVNAALPQGRIDDVRLKKAFDKFYRELRRQIDRIAPDSASQAVPRSDRDLLEEIVQAIRLSYRNDAFFSSVVEKLLQQYPGRNPPDAGLYGAIIDATTPFRDAVLSEYLSRTAPSEPGNGP
jgi:TIR domain